MQFVLHPAALFLAINLIFVVTTPLMQQQVTFPSGTVNYYFGQSVNNLPKVVDMEHAIYVTDEHIAQLYPDIFKEWRTLVLPAGEDAKDIATVTSLTTQLLQMEATRKTLLIGVGGGVITDITGFLAGVYMRGVRFGFVPTTLLGMVDAAIGGKNGVNVGLHKNILGTIRQPDFIFYDSSFLQTLPKDEWSNGFAEIIKYGCVFDENMLRELQVNSIGHYMENAEALDKLIMRCVAWKNKTVAEDEQERGIRKLLNFGHTVGHAIEKLYGLSHGKAVGIGMVVASMISEEVFGSGKNFRQQLEDMLLCYGLPARLNIESAAVMELLKTDKKRNKETIDYILVKACGRGVIQPLPLHEIEKALAVYESNS